MRKAKNRLSQNKIDGRLIRKGDSHENPDPHQPPSRTPPQDNQKPHTEAGTGLAIIDYKRSSTDTLLSSQTTTTHPTKPTPRRKPAGERQQENNIHHHPHPRNPTTTKHPTNPRKTNQTPACRKHPTTPTHTKQHNQHNNNPHHGMSGACDPYLLSATQSETHPRHVYPYLVPMSALSLIDTRYCPVTTPQPHAQHSGVPTHHASASCPPC